MATLLAQLGLISLADPKWQNTDYLLEFLRANRREQTLLFVGAGFSAGCETQVGHVPDGGRLAALLNSKLGPTSALSLQVAAFEYLDRFGEDSYASLLSACFLVKKTSPELKPIAAQPWFRVYTTNYDNAIEILANVEPKFVLSPLNSDMQHVSQARSVHIHGYVGHITPKNVRTDFKLKFDDFDSPLDENIMYLFQRDLANSKGVIFCGYSFNDLDIRRIIRISGLSPNQLLFIQRPDLSDDEAIMLNRYGTVCAIGKSEFSQLLVRETGPSVPAASLFAPINFDRQDLSQAISGIVSNEEILRIYTMGNLDVGHFRANEHQPRLVISRSAIQTILDNYEIGERLIAIHSDIGNGKSSVIKNLLYILPQRTMECYIYLGGAALDPREISYFSERGDQVCLVFDSDLVSPSTVLDYADRLPSARVLYALRSVHIELRRRGGWEKLQQFAISDLNILTQGEIDQLKDIFDTYGLWGADSREKDSKKVFNPANTDLRSILLTFFETEYIKGAIARSVAEIVADNDSVRDVYVLILILSYFGLRPSNAYIQRLAGIAALSEFVRFIDQDDDVAENVRYSNGQFRYYSSNYALFVVRNIILDSVKTEVMLSVFRKSENFDIDVIYSLRIALTRFGDVNGLFSNSPHRAERIIAYYDAVSRIKSQNGNYLFWLQFAIACTVFDRFDLAETYFANAYRLGKNKDPFQIDNHFAKFLLKSRLRRTDQYDDFYWAFDQAHRLSKEQYRVRDEARFPLEVFGMYGEFMETVAGKFDSADRESALSQLSELSSELGVVRRQPHIPLRLQASARTSVERAIKRLSQP